MGNALKTMTSSSHSLKPGRIGREDSETVLPGRAHGEAGVSLRRGAEIRELKARDNHTNFFHIARVYLIIAATVGGTVWAFGALEAHGLSVWWKVAAAVAAIFVIGASQHQLGGIVHEGTHHILFANRTLNEAASDWLAAFPLYTSTFHFRLHHLAHHQFVNDPKRDPDVAQLEDSGHWLDFPITHVEMLLALLKQLWLPNLVRYTLSRLRFSALGAAHNPYLDKDKTATRLPTLIGLVFAGGVPAGSGILLAMGHGALAVSFVAAAIAVALTYYALMPESHFPHARIAPALSHRVTNVGRIGHMALVYGVLTVIEAEGWGPAWQWFGLLWVLPLFTTFPLFMIMRQWVQHGNADRGRLTNSRIFLVNPLLRYAIFPFGMDYHLPHHLYAAVPHYRLKALHELLLADPEYREKGVMVEGYFHAPHAGEAHRNPTVLEVLGQAWAPKAGGEVYVDDAAIAETDLTDRAAVARESEASRAGR